MTFWVEEMMMKWSGDWRAFMTDIASHPDRTDLDQWEFQMQARVLDQLKGPKLVGCDTMNHWIQESRPVLEALLKRVDMLVVNDEEAELLTGDRNVVKAAAKILGSGPSRVLIKRGEYGVIEFSGDTVFAVPAYPLEEVIDPTGAGDCFAAGVMGAAAATVLMRPLSELDSGSVAYASLGAIGVLAVVIAGWTTANPMLYRAGLALQVITPGWPRWKDETEKTSRH